MFNLGPLEMIIVMGIAVLLFGKRLPEVGRTLGKGIVEFRKGLNGLGEDLDISGTGHSSTSHSSSPWRSEERSAAEAGYTDASVPKFELPAVESTTSPPAPPTMEYYQPPPPPHD
jgi:sec-independent protein translocase protein TatA